MIAVYEVEEKQKLSCGGEESCCLGFSLFSLFSLVFFGVQLSLLSMLLLELYVCVSPGLFGELNWTVSLMWWVGHHQL